MPLPPLEELCLPEEVCGPEEAERLEGGPELGGPEVGGPEVCGPVVACVLEGPEGPAVVACACVAVAVAAEPPP